MHDEHSKSRNEIWLARQLRDAARRDRPQFSAALHQRIMQSIRPAASNRIAGPFAVGQRCAERIGAKAVASVEARPAKLRRRYWTTAGWLTAAAATVAVAIIGRSFVGQADRGDARATPTVNSQPAISQPVAVKPVSPVKPGAEILAAKPIEGSLANSASANDRSANHNLVESNGVSNRGASTAVSYTLDDLSRDAKATAHLLVDQLPFEAPAEEWGL